MKEALNISLYPSILFEGLRRHTKNINQYSLCPGRIRIRLTINFFKKSAGVYANFYDCNQHSETVPASSNLFVMLSSQAEIYPSRNSCLISLSAAYFCLLIFNLNKGVVCYTVIDEKHGKLNTGEYYIRLWNRYVLCLWKRPILSFSAIVFGPSKLLLTADSLIIECSGRMCQMPCWNKTVISRTWLVLRCSLTHFCTHIA